MTTAPQLFAGTAPAGPHRCFFCAGKCGEDVAAKDFVKSSFTSLDTVTLSRWVCLGCVASQQEDAEIVLADGERRAGQKVRGYSWVIESHRRTAATKAHREWLIGQCLDPPGPPFVISIADSGQKHLLYRAVVNHDRDQFTVTLEGERILYRPHELFDRLILARRICAATGKPALADPLSPQSQMRITDHYKTDVWLAAWLAVESQPLSRLATWLCPKKEDCEREFPSATRAATVSEPRDTAAAPERRHRGPATTLSLFD